MCSVKKARSIVISCETFTTESCGRRETRVGSAMLPGASASRRLLVITATIAVWIALRLKESACITSTGRLKPGSEPRGLRRSAHQSSPRRTSQSLVTTVLASEVSAVRSAAPDQLRRVPLNIPRSIARSLIASGCVRENLSKPRHKVDSARRVAVWPSALPCERAHLEGTLLSSHLEYNQRYTQTENLDYSNESEAWAAHNAVR